MSRALRQHCGSFLHDNIRRDWPIEGAEAENAAEEKNMADEGKGEEGSVVLQCAPKEWPLFDTPAISSMRVTGFENKGGTVVSEQTPCGCVVLTAKYNLANLIYLCFEDKVEGGITPIVSLVTTATAGLTLSSSFQQFNG